MKHFLINHIEKSNQFRSAPFWAWNSKLEPEEIRRQIRIMHQMHMGGFFMHSRAGLATQYLGKEYFECVNAAIDEAKKLNMHASLYDEDRWPSGAAGGLATKDKRYRMQYLEEYDLSSPIIGEKNDYILLNVFALHIDKDGNVIEYKKAVSNETLPPNWVLKQYVSRIADNQENYNGAAYLDTTDKDSVENFIKSTHEKYYQECGDKFGKSVKYFFTDEPNYLDFVSSNRRPWSKHLAQEFSKSCNLNIIDYLPELFHQCGKHFSPIRYYYYRIMTQLFVDNFLKRIGNWCQNHHIKLTGHLLREDSLSSQILSIGSAMASYQYMQAPGIDILTAKWMTLNTVKQVSSVANQLGNKTILSELYGCTGWDFPLYGQKFLAEWQYALGVNLRCQHLTWYSMQGEAKRDYPASIGEQSPWYKIYAPLEDYLAKLANLLTDTAERIPLLVIHPIESMWGYAGKYDLKLSFDPQYDKKFENLATNLLSCQMPFDYGDESLMAEYGKIIDGKIKISNAQYEVILIPEVETLRSSTVKLLEEFSSSGNKVFFIGSIPKYIDGILDKSNQLEKLYSNFIKLNENNYAEELHTLYSYYSIKNQNNSYTCNILSKAGYYKENIEILYTVNIGTNLANHMDLPYLEELDMTAKNLKFSYTSQEGKIVCKLDLFTNTFIPIKFAYHNGKYDWEDDIAPLNSNCYVLGPQEAFATLSKIEEKVYSKKVSLQKNPAIFDEQNLLVLDYANAYENNTLTVKNTYILDIDKTLRKKHNLPLRGSNQLQPYLRNKDNIAFPVTLEFEFYCQTILKNDIYLILENPNSYSIFINNTNVNNQSCGYWCDSSLKKILLNKELLKIGLNKIKLEILYTDNFSGFESIYLMGNFGVENHNTLVKLKDVYSGQCLTEQNYPFYSGNTTYNYTFILEKEEDCQIKLNSFYGSALSFKIDNKEEQISFLPSGQQNLCVKLAPGKHQLSITIYGHRRNAFGPFYCERFFWIGPYEFSTTKLKEKKVVPLGLLEDPEVFLA